jgi:hypothetical protein
MTTVEDHMKASIQVVTYGYVPTSVIDLVREGIADALHEMDFIGDLPIAHISEGPIIDNYDAEIHACYTSKDCAVRCWWQGVGKNVIGVPNDVRNDVGFYFFAAHEAVHHVQWQRGYGESTIDDGTAAYCDHPLEVEAQNIAHRLTARRFGLIAPEERA